MKDTRVHSARGIDQLVLSFTTKNDVGTKKFFIISFYSLLRLKGFYFSGRQADSCCEKFERFFAIFLRSCLLRYSDGWFIFRFLLRPRTIRPVRMSHLRGGRTLLRRPFVRISYPILLRVGRQYPVWKMISIERLETITKCFPNSSI